MTIKERLRGLVEELDEADAAEALEYVEWMLAASELLTAAELESVATGDEQISRGEFRTLAALRETLER